MEHMILIDNKIGFIKYIVMYGDEENRQEREFSDKESLDRFTVRLDEKGIEYTVTENEIAEHLLKFEGEKAKSWDEALAKINGTYVEPVTVEQLKSENEMLMDAVIELAEMIAGGE